jgi:hypothetical protein
LDQSHGELTFVLIGDMQIHLFNFIIGGIGQDDKLDYGQDGHHRQDGLVSEYL